MRSGLAVGAGAVLLACTLILPAGVCVAAGSSSDDPKVARMREIQEIKQEMRLLERRVEDLEGQNSELKKSNTQIKDDTQKLQTVTSQQIQTLQSQVTAAPSPASFADAFNRYLGRYRFTLVGGVAGSFIFDRASNVNTFALDVEPILLWQISDRILFETTIEANLPAGSSADYQLPVADFHIFLNDYMTLVMGALRPAFRRLVRGAKPVLGKSVRHDAAALWRQRADPADRCRDAVARRLPVGCAGPGRGLHGHRRQWTELHAERLCRQHLAFVAAHLLVDRARGRHD